MTLAPGRCGFQPHRIPWRLYLSSPNTGFNLCELQLLSHRVLLEIERNSSLKNTTICDIISRFCSEIREESDFVVAELQQSGIKNNSTEPE